MSQRSLAATIAPLLTVAVTSAHAASCSDDIARLEAAVRDQAANPLGGPSAPQSISAQLRRQPTPDSVRRAQGEAQLRFAALLSYAKALDARGDHAQCAQAVGKAKHMLGLD